MNIDFTSFDQALDKAETNAPDMEKVWAEIRAFDIPSELETFLSKKVAGMDPFSQEYRDIMQEIHVATITGPGRSAYSIQDEGLSDLDIETFASWGGIWFSHDWTHIRELLKMCTNLVSLLKSLPSGSSVLECGCGLGGLSEFLTLSGLAVDALDVNETQCSIVKRRLQPLVEHGGPESHVICEDLSSYLSTTDRIYDVILFEASFHHFMNHQDILHEIVSRHMNSSSLILFINEPILKQKTKILPYAWGPRLDGESLFQMRRRGWLELGYTEDYIYEMCHRLNIGIVRFTLPGTRAVSYALSKDQKILDTIGEGYYSLRDYIVNCYRFILGREPESEKVVDKYLESVKSLHCIREKLRKVFLTSEEFKRNL